MRVKKSFQIAVTALFVMGFAASANPSPPQIPQTAPHWADVPADTMTNLKDEGIHAGKYERLICGEVLTETRPVPAGKTGVHVAAFGIIRGSVDKLWNLVEDCGNSPPLLPCLKSCKVVQPDHPLPPNRRWEQLKIDFRLLFFTINTTLVNETTFEAPNYLRWNQVRGDAKISEGYLRIISITPGTQIVIYDALVDPGSLVPEFVKTWIVHNTLPDLITALRDHV